MTLGFGRYAGKPTKDIPIDYIERTIAWIEKYRERPNMGIWVEELPYLKKILRGKLRYKRHNKKET